MTAGKITDNRGQRSTLVTHKLSVPRGRDSNPSGGENFPFMFLNCDLVIAYLPINS